MKKLATILASLAVLSGSIVFGQTITLTFDSLPSAQTTGNYTWTYFQGNGTPESPTFSYTGTSLIMNTIGLGDTDPNYAMFGIVDGTKPFVLTVRAKILAYEGSNPGGFFIDVRTASPNQEYAIEFTDHSVSDPLGNTFAVDTTVFHTYVLSGTPGGNYKLTIDGNEAITGPFSATGGALNAVQFGDGAYLYDTNANAEITKLVFSQGGCQVSIPNRWSQLDPRWGPNTYDYYNVSLCQSHPPNKAECKIGDATTCCRMQRLGCTTTSLAMSLNTAGVVDVPDPITGGLASFDPGVLNAFMDIHDDYTKTTHDVQPEISTLDVSYATLGLRGGKLLHFDDDNVGDNSLDTLKSLVCAGNAVVVKVASLKSCIVQPGPPGGHYVLVTGEHLNPSTGGPQFDIADPGCKSISSLDQYGNDFRIRGFISDPQDASTLEVFTDDGADLLVSDSDGRSTGIDPATGTEKREIPRSAYSQDYLTDSLTGKAGAITHSVNLFQPSQGKFSVSITGLKLGPFELTIAPFSVGGKAQPRTSIVGIASPGSENAYEVQYVSSDGGQSQATQITTFNGTVSDIQNAFRLDLITSDRLAQWLSYLIQQAREASGDKRNDYLLWFKAEVRYHSGNNSGKEAASGGSHDPDRCGGDHARITGAAVQVLLQDADSLLQQNGYKGSN